MSELTHNNIKLAVARRRLLGSVSALALLTLIPARALAEDDQPIIWIELGGQFERLDNPQEAFGPSFASLIAQNPFTLPAKIEAPPRFSIGEEASVSFNPEGSDWFFSASVRYGRANKNRSIHQETVHPSVQLIESIPYFNINQTGHEPALENRFATTASQTDSANLVMDFQAGKDVGLGSFGMSGSSTFDAGIRFAQFTSRTKSTIDSDPNFKVSYKYITQLAGHSAYVKFPKQSWDLYHATMNASRIFIGIGPSLEWHADTLLAGRSNTAGFTFDWGVNGAMLFGRQKMRAHHATNTHYRSYRHASGPLPVVYKTPHGTARSRSVLVPNFGGFAGASLRFPNAKISLGYRADLFFGAIDGGIDKVKRENVGFYGPFASISVGIGG